MGMEQSNHVFVEVNRMFLFFQTEIFIRPLDYFFVVQTQSLFLLIIDKLVSLMSTIFMILHLIAVRESAESSQIRML